MRQGRVLTGPWRVTDSTGQVCPQEVDVNRPPSRRARATVVLTAAILGSADSRLAPYVASMPQYGHTMPVPSFSFLANDLRLSIDPSPNRGQGL